MSPRAFRFRSCLFYGCLTPLIIALVLAVPVWYFCIHAPPLVISETTTRITEPLTADGYIDFFKAFEERISPPELATDENGFRIFVRQFGLITDYPISKSYRVQKYQKLGLDLDVPPTSVFPDSHYKVVYDFYKTANEKEPDNWRNDFDSPWTLEQYPMLTDWIKEIDEPLDAIAEMIRKPIFFAPLMQPIHDSSDDLDDVMWTDNSNLNVLYLPDIYVFRDVAQMFQARAMYRIAHGNIDGAIADKLTIHRLGRLISSQGNEIAFFAGIGIEGIAGTIPVGANPEHPLTEAQIRRVLAGLDTLPPRISLHEILERTRMIVLSGVQIYKRHMTLFRAFHFFFLDRTNIDYEFARDTFNIDRHRERRWNTAAANACDWNLVYRQVNEVFDVMLQAPRPGAKFQSLWKEWEATSTLNRLSGMFTAAGRARIAGNSLAFFFIPYCDGFENITHRIECSENMQRLFWAMQLYRLDNAAGGSEMPVANWAEQIEQYLGENSAQYFSCPANPSPEGQTTYALVQYGETVQNLDTILLVELKESVPFDKAVITVDEVLAKRRIGTLHGTAMNVVHQSGAVRTVWSGIDEEEMLRLLGQNE